MGAEENFYFNHEGCEANAYYVWSGAFPYGDKFSACCPFRGTVEVFWFEAPSKGFVVSRLRDHSELNSVVSALFSRQSYSHDHAHCRNLSLFLFLFVFVFRTVNTIQLALTVKSVWMGFTEMRPMALQVTVRFVRAKHRGQPRKSQWYKLCLWCCRSSPAHALARTHHTHTVNAL